ncbi:MAG: AMP-binding protein [Chloroflexota bacterium]|nr:AMP-binding protein [Chloroflexota bacterium]
MSDAVRPRNVRGFLEAAVERNAECPFLVWQDTPMSYAAFNNAVDRAADMWRRLGVRKGDRVAFLLDNRPEFLVAWLGLAKIGGVLTAVNTAFKGEEASYPVEHSEALFALTSAEHAEVMASVAKRVRTLRGVVTLDERPGTLSYAALMAAAEPRAPAVELESDDLISLIYTSGTTGRPKGVMQTHGNYVLTGEAYPAWVGLGRRERIYVCLPLFHANSQIYATMGTIGAGATMILVPRFSASRFWGDVRRHHVNVFNFVGAMPVILSRSAPSPADRAHEARVGYGAPTLPPTLRDALELRFGLRIVSGFGMSETTFGLIESLTGERRPLSMGKPRQHPDPTVSRNEARVVDELGRDVPDGEIGELVFRNAALMRGYFKDPRRTTEALRKGWLYTGDLARRDADGFFYYVDRRKDIVRRRGENVSSVEVEAVLVEHPDVLEVAIIGVPSELTEEDILAVIVPRPSRTIDPSALVAWSAGRLASFKVPRYVSVVEALPKTSSLKVEKDRLRETWRDLGHVVDTQVAMKSGGERS